MCGFLYITEPRFYFNTHTQAVSTPANFCLDPLPEGDVYTIIPATFDPGHHGAFFVTVSAECDFVFTKVREHGSKGDGGRRPSVQHDGGH